MGQNVYQHQNRRKSKEPAMAISVNERNEEQNKHHSKIRTNSAIHTDSNEEIFEEIRGLFKPNLSNEDILSTIIINKQKEDLASLISQEFNLGNCDIKKSFAYVTRFMNNSDQTDQMYQEEISLYRNMCEELLRRSKDTIDEEQMKSYFNKIGTVENEIEKQKC